MRSANRHGLLLLLGLLLPGCPEVVVPAPEDADGPAPELPEGLGDEFAGDGLAPRWSVLLPDSVRLQVAEGALHLEPLRRVVWYEAERGPAVVQRVSGSFKLSARVRVRGLAAPELPPDRDYQFGGIMVRDPRSDGPAGQENYVFSVLGFRGSYLSAETKSTRDGRSEVAGPAWGSGDGELRICRIGAVLRLYNRAVGAARWRRAITYERPDLPAELQAGLIAYAMSDAPDLRAGFDWVRFASVSRAADCESD